MSTIEVSGLVPAFDPAITDYYVRCEDGDNTLEITVDGVAETDVMSPDDLLQLGDYAIRCLPPSFPQLTVITHPENGAPTAGYYLVNSSPYVMVLDTNGVPIWYEATAWGCNTSSPLPDTIAYMPRAVYPYSINDESFYEIHDLATGDVRTLITDDSPTDEHELVRLDNGDYLVFTDPITQMPDEAIADCKIEELDAADHVVWSWLASDHVDYAQENLFASTNVIGTQTVYDVFHCNSIEVGPNDDLLVSMRHTSALYDLDRATGTVQWKLGGNAYSKDGAPHLEVVGDADGGFNMQHDARFTSTGNVTLFDDHGLTSGVARGIELQLDHAAGTAQIVWQARGDEPSDYMGGFRRYADGESVIAWGYLEGENVIFTEYNADALPVFEIATYLPTTFNALSYRAVKVPLEQLDRDLLRQSAASR